MNVVFHDDPFTPFDEEPIAAPSAPSIAIPDHLLPDLQDARLRVGVRPLEVSQWTSPVDDDWWPTLALKMRLLSTRRDEVVGMIPGAEDACSETAHGLASYMGVDLNRYDTGLDALVRVASLVADDVCVLVPEGDDLVLGAAVLCAPNRWRLRNKIGFPMEVVHAPVARYDTDLSAPVDSVLARLAVEKPVWRANWGLVNHPALFQPDTPPATPEMYPGDLWMRIEYQTLRRLPNTGAIVFTIRTYTERLSELGRRHPPIRGVLYQLITQLPDNVLAYKSIAPYKDSLITWCSQR